MLSVYRLFQLERLNSSWTEVRSLLQHAASTREKDKAANSLFLVSFAGGSPQALLLYNFLLFYLPAALDARVEDVCVKVAVARRVPCVQQCVLLSPSLLLPPGCPSSRSNPHVLVSSTEELYEGTASTSEEGV